MDISALTGWELGPGRLPQRLAAALERALVAGVLGDGPLPAERRLAAALGISRGTVTAAYAELKDRKLVASRPGGYTEPDHVALAAPVRAARLAARWTVEETILREYATRDPAGLDLSFAFLGTPEGAQPLIDAAFARALTHRPNPTGYVAAGLAGLRERIADWYTHTLLLRTSADQIVITQGAYQAIYLAAMLALSPGDTVVAEVPMYPGALDIFRMHGAVIRDVGMFDEPKTLDALERAGTDVALVYATSAYRNPIGTTIDARSAARLARWSARADVTVVDDRALGLCGFGEWPRPLASFAPDAPILTLGSLDKTTGAGTRIGWMRVPRATAPKLARLKAIADLTSPPLMQQVAIELHDDLAAIAALRSAELKRRYERLAARLRTRFPRWRWETPAGGASIWVDVATDADVLQRAAGRAGVTLVTGSAFLPGGEHGRHVRIAFARPETLLDAAVDRLASVVRSG
ncbi:MAG TPA: PLP-dependent aminotransferase family protein [Candidatus Sulfotelmatobacter sp.]|nr:PLP-dependent aminotransferase family protein [Candidatus Sulfotelmatobacter sp.]